MTLIASALGEVPSASDIFGWPVLFPALAFGAAVTLLLTALGAADQDRATLPTVAALALSAFGIVPLATALAPGAAEAQATYAPFFPSNTIGLDGRVGGNVVYVLDLGAHNQLLRARFGGRTWFRFGPHLRRGDPDPSLTPYVQAAR